MCNFWVFMRRICFLPISLFRDFKRWCLWHILRGEYGWNLIYLNGWWNRCEYITNPLKLNFFGPTCKAHVIYERASCNICLFGSKFERWVSPIMLPTLTHKVCKNISCCYIVGVWLSWSRRKRLTLLFIRNLIELNPFVGCVYSTQLGPQ
jgi:hypothetical protein